MTKLIRCCIYNQMQILFTILGVSLLVMGISHAIITTEYLHCEVTDTYSYRGHSYVLYVDEDGNEWETEGNPAHLQMGNRVVLKMNTNYADDLREWEIVNVDLERR